MKDFSDFLFSLGGLHDSAVAEVKLQPAQQKIEIHIEDLYSNFVGLPEYPGRQSGVLVLLGVADVSVSLADAGQLLIFECTCASDD